MARFLWVTASGGWEISAKDEEQATRVALANRMATGQTIEEAASWFHKDDAIYEIDGPVSDAPYEGEIPEPEI